MSSLCPMLPNRYVPTDEENEIYPDASKMLCCCCWPPYFCSLALSVIDAGIVGIFTFRAADLLYKSAGIHTDWIDVAIFLALLALFICELLSLLTLALSHHRNNSRYVLPRLTLLTGQFAITTFICIILILYFIGFSQKINDVIINTYQYWTGEELNDIDRKNIAQELFMYAVGIFVVMVIYTIYELFELYITRKYQNTLDTPPEFIPVRQQEPARLAGPKLSIDQPHFVPPPPYNPQYR